MKYHTLGPTGLLVSEICLGTMTFSLGEGMWKLISGVEQNLADQLLKRSFDAGVNFVDTADVYASGESETTLAKVLAKPFVTSDMIGARRIAQLDQNLAAVDSSPQRRLSNSMKSAPCRRSTPVGWFLSRT